MEKLKQFGATIKNATSTWFTITLATGKKSFLALKAKAQTVGKKILLALSTQQDLDDRLTKSVASNDLEAAKIAIADGAKCDIFASDDKHPAVMAMNQNNMEMLQLLIDKNTMTDGVNTSTNFYDGPLLFHAIKTNNMAAFDLLCAAGAKLHVTMHDGLSLVAFAIEHKKKDFITKLIEKSAPIDMIDERGWTPLFHAVKKGDAELVKTLLALNVRTYLRDKNGYSILDIAQQYERFDLYNMIQNHIDAAVPEWRKDGDDCVVHTKILRSAGYKLTQVFNFKTNQHTVVTHNFNTGIDVPETKSFEILAQPELIAKAREQLRN